MLRKFAMFGVLAVIAAGCAGPGADGDAANYQSKSQFDKVGGKRDASGFVDPQDGNATRVAAGNFMPSTGARVEIRGASLDVRVANLDDSEKRVQQIIKQSGGYEQALSSSDLAGSNPLLSITTKVPVEKLDDVIAQVEGLGTRTAKTVSMEDVTEQLVAWDARMNTLKQRQEALKQVRKPRNVVPNDLQTINQELVALQHQRDAMAAKAAFSTLELTLRQGAVAGGPKDPSWFSESYGQASSAFAVALRFVATIGLWVVFMSPFYLPFLIIGWAVYRTRRRGNLHKLAAPPVV